MFYVYFILAGIVIFSVLRFIFKKDSNSRLNNRGESFKKDLKTGKYKKVMEEYSSAPPRSSSPPSPSLQRSQSSFEEEKRPAPVQSKGGGAVQKLDAMFEKNDFREEEESPKMKKRAAPSKKIKEEVLEEADDDIAFLDVPEPIEDSYFEINAESAKPIAQPVINKKDLHTEPANEGDLVNCTAYSPAKVAKGEGFLVKVFAHLQEQAIIVDEMVKETDPELAKRAVKPLNLKVKQKQEIQFILSIADWDIDDPNQNISWWGQPSSVEYWVDVPESYFANSVLAKLLVFVDGTPAGSLKFKIDLERSTDLQEQNATVEACHYRFAFISYASPDRDEVLRRAQMLQASKIDFFQDVLELEPGQRWEKELYRNIEKCDVFFLFWSNASKSSEWVKREWQYALELQRKSANQLPDIIPVAIEKPIPLPPDELNYLHFGNAILQILKGK